MRTIRTASELQQYLEKRDVEIQAISPYGLQEWIDWLLENTQKAVTKENIISAINEYGLNYQW